MMSRGFLRGNIMPPPFTCRHSPLEATQDVSKYKSLLGSRRLNDCLQSCVGNGGDLHQRSLQPSPPNGREFSKRLTGLLTSLPLRVAHARRGKKSQVSRTRTSVAGWKTGTYQLLKSSRLLQFHTSLLLLQFFHESLWKHTHRYAGIESATISSCMNHETPVWRGNGKTTDRKNDNSTQRGRLASKNLLLHWMLAPLYRQTRQRRLSVNTPTPVRLGHLSLSPPFSRQNATEFERQPNLLRLW